MAIKDRIKEARINKKYTQEQLANLIGVAKSTVTGYEKGNSEPNIETMGKIMTALDVDANFLWQDETDFPIQVSYMEMEHIKKYRTLDEHGKDMVDMVLSKEYERVLHLQQTAVSAPAAETVSFPAHLVVNAAHADENSTAEDRQADDDMMMDDSEWE